MNVKYDYNAMNQTSNNLRAILFKKLNKDTLQEFQNLALSLEWEGAAADIFRSKVFATIAGLQQYQSEKLVKELEVLANFPDKCAEELKRADEKCKAFL